jgi:hypothetical protein
MMMMTCLILSRTRGGRFDATGADVGDGALVAAGRGVPGALVVFVADGEFAGEGKTAAVGEASAALVSLRAGSGVGVDGSAAGDAHAASQPSASTATVKRNMVFIVPSLRF